MTISEITAALQKNAPDGFYIKYDGGFESKAEKLTVDNIEFFPPFYQYKFGKDGNDIILGVAATDKKIFVQEKAQLYDRLMTTKPDKAFFKKLYNRWAGDFLKYDQIKINELLAVTPKGFTIKILQKDVDDFDLIEEFEEKNGLQGRYKISKNAPSGIASLTQDSSGKSVKFGYFADPNRKMSVSFKYGDFKTGEMEAKRGLKTLSELIDNTLTSTKAPSAGGGGGGVSSSVPFTAAEQAEIQDALYNAFGLDGKVQAVFKMGNRAQAVRVYPYAGSLKGRKAFNNRIEFGDEFTKRQFRGYTQYGGGSNFSDGLESFLSKLKDEFKKLPSEAEYLANPEILKRGTANKEFRVKKTLDAVRKAKRESNKKSVARGRGKERSAGADSPTRADEMPQKMLNNFESEINAANLSIPEMEEMKERIFKQWQDGIKTHKKKYGHIDISEPMSAAEKQSDSDNSALFSKVNILNRKIREVKKAETEERRKKVRGEQQAKRAENAANEMPKPEAAPNPKAAKKAANMERRGDIKNTLAKGRAKRAENDLNAPESAQAWDKLEKIPKERKKRAAGLVRGAYKESVKRILQKIRTREKAITILQNEIKALQ